MAALHKPWTPKEFLSMNRLRSLGPGLLVTAAFIGPGTVTTATVAGAGFGFTLLWAVLFSTLATIVLQEMSARLGVVSRVELGEAVRRSIASPPLRIAAVVLIVAAIGFGNAAFQTGNITGATLGLESATGIPRRIGALIFGAAAFFLLSLGSYRNLERCLIGLVALMSLAFLITAAIVRPNLVEALSGALTPDIPEGSLMTVLAVVGTTVVPYNLFLHASAVREKWPASVPVEESLRGARTDAMFSIAIGGLVTATIMATAASTFAPGTVIRGAEDMAAQWGPLVGPAAGLCFSIGLIAAGLTSAITAPLAAAYAASGVLGWKGGPATWRFRAVWAVVLVIGTGLAATGIEPIKAIIFAQAANGILLPLIAVFLIVVVNRKALLGEYTNGIVANTLGVCVVAVTAGLGVFAVYKVLVKIGWLAA